MYACSLELLGAPRLGGGGLRPVAPCVGVLARVTGVMARDDVEAGLAREVLAVACERFTAVGELERVEAGLEGEGLFAFRIETGNLEVVLGWPRPEGTVVDWVSGCRGLTVGASE